jgi:bifunctional UDP-N-acetylglucosamine pyrophosphorylase/glucosamine-1-phosphate N-acetyltransferase
MLDPDQVWVGPGVTVGRDTELLPGTMLRGTTSVGEGCVVGPLSRLTNTQVGNGCTIDETVAVGAVIGNGVSCGPRAYLREGTVLMDGSKAGTHVELKKSTVGPGSKVPHLSYLGDCTVGADVNIGAGTITCNYDGKYKHSTTIGDGAFIGSDTMLVAPVNVGAGATVGAGSTITKDVPSGDVLALERSEQRVRLGWKPAWAREAATGDAPGTL